MYFDRLEKTIAAIATAPGSSIGIIRISGNMAIPIAEAISGKKDLEAMKVQLISAMGNDGNIIEKCLMLIFRAPKSYTGEDIAEFHVHGSAIQARKFIDIIIKYGAIPALSGEFSFRAVVNGKMNINEAVGLCGLIQAQDETTLAFSRKEAFENRFVSYIKEIFDEWERLFVVSTALLDFPEHISDYLPLKTTLELLEKTNTSLLRVLSNSSLLRNSSKLSIVITGKPNVGKSLLFNMLINKNRAIVSETSGTTRDYITDHLYIKDSAFNITDTAGIRKTENNIEKEGIEKTISLIEIGDLTLLVLDGSIPLDERDYDILSKTADKKRIIVINKKDQGFILSEDFEHCVKISAKTGDGVEDLKNIIEKMLIPLLPDDNLPVFLSSWQNETASRLIERLAELKENLGFGNIDLVSFLIKECYQLLMSLTGKIEKESVYEKIFSGFCIGK